MVCRMQLVHGGDTVALPVGLCCGAGVVQVLTHQLPAR